MKIYKIKKMILAVVAAIVLVGAFSGLHSCSNDDTLSVSKQLVFLDIDNTDKLTVEKINIIEEAQKRIDPYTRTYNGKIELTISSGEKINVSDRLFNLMTKSIEITNEKIINKELILFDGKLFKYNLSIKKPQRIKLLTLESSGNNYTSIDDYYSWGHTSVTTYDQAGAREYCQDFQNNNTIQGGIAGALLSFVKTPPIVGAAVALGSAYLTYYQARALYDAANNGSITVTTTEMWGYPEQGTTTVVKDQSGKTVIVF